MEVLERNGRLARVKKPVKKEFELGRIAWKLRGGPGVLFENVEDYQIPVITGVLNPSNQPFYFGLKDEADLVKKFHDGLGKTIKPQTVSKGPCQEVVITENIGLLKTLPIPQHSPLDGGPYITIGVVVSKDPETGERSQSVNRMHVKGPDKTMIDIPPGIRRHKEIMLNKAIKMNKPLEIAVAIGVDPAVSLSAGGIAGTSFQALAHVGYVDKYEVAGGMRGAPIELVRCKTVDLEVPAHSEVVIEAEILPHTIEDEGPFSEGAGYMSRVYRNHVVKVKAITHRKAPIYHTLLGASPEHGLGEIIRKAAAMDTLPLIQRFAPQVTALNVNSLFSAIVAVNKTMEGQAKNAILTVMGTHPLIKLVIAVDEDVDVFDYHDVFNAMTQRFDGEKCVFMVPDALSRRLDPATRVGKYSDGIITKVGIDATMALDKKIDQPMVDKGYEDIDLTKFLDKEVIERLPLARKRTLV